MHQIKCYILIREYVLQMSYLVAHSRGMCILKMIYGNTGHVGLFFLSLPTGTGLYSNKAHYHLLFVVPVFTLRAATQRTRENQLLSCQHCFQYQSQYGEEENN